MLVFGFVTLRINPLCLYSRGECHCVYVDCAAALGIIERGETKHGFVMGQSLMHFVMQLQVDHMKPVGLGVLGPEILPSQINPRVQSYARKAIVAAAAMLEE